MMIMHYNTLCIECRFLGGLAAAPVTVPLDFALVAPSIWSSDNTLISGPIAELAVESGGPLSDGEWSESYH